MHACEGRKDRRWNKVPGVREKVSGENLFLDYSNRGNACGVRIFLPEKDKSFSSAGSKRCWEKQFPAARFTTRRSTPRFSRGKDRKIRLCRYSMTRCFYLPCRSELYRGCLHEEKEVPSILIIKKNSPNISNIYNRRRHQPSDNIWFMYVKRRL